MSIKTVGYSRKRFHVEAIKVTDENMEELAAWCGGKIRTTSKVIRDDDHKIIDRKEVSFIKVDVYRSLNERQTKGYCGDWVLLSDAGVKIYTQRAFEKTFELEEGVEENPPVQLSLDIPEITLTLEGSRA